MGSLQIRNPYPSAYSDFSLYNHYLYLFSVPPLDYSAVSIFLKFDSCETRQCTNIAIMNDALVESAESFSVILERTSELDTRITLDPDVGEIVINDGLF